MMPWRQSRSTISGVLWPARLSHTRRSRRGGRAAGKLKRTANPSRPACHKARFAAGSSGAALAGSAATICPKASFSQPCRTVFVPLVAGRRLTRPVAGWNRVRILAVPARTYSCDWVAGGAPRPPPPPRGGTGWEGAAPAPPPAPPPPPGPPPLGVLDHFFSAGGWVPVPAPPRPRRRRTTPVSHHVRVFCQLSPAARSVRQIV